MLEVLLDLLTEGRGDDVRSLFAQLIEENSTLTARRI